MTNAGSALLTITSIVASGDFDRTNTCGGTVAPAANCTISVTFTPTTTGSRTGEVTITDNAAGSPHAVGLTGIGTNDFAIDISPASATVTAGQSATYTVTLTPQGGPFDDPISLSCSTPPFAALLCSFSPSTVTPGASPGTSTLTVSTAAPSAFLAPPFSPQDDVPLYALWLAVSGLVLVGLARAGHDFSKKRLGFYLSLGLLLASLTLISCGDVDVGGFLMGPPFPGTAPGTYTITVTGAFGSLQHSSTVTLIVQ